MYKVKTFGIEIRPLKTMKELTELDEMVNKFISEHNIKNVVSVSDVATTDDKGGGDNYVIIDTIKSRENKEGGS